MKKSIFILVIVFAFIYVIVKNFSTSPQVPQSYFNSCLIFKPDNYDEDKKYPLMFMLHGYSGNQNQWTELADLNAYANKYNFIIVCPDGHYGSWYVDSPFLKESQFETYFFDTLAAEIFDEYNIDKQKIFITGLSMGGHGAMYLFLNHPDFFKSAGSTSGILDLMPFPENWEIKDVIGDQANHKENWVKYSAINNLSRIKNSHRKIIVDCGTGDFAYDVNKSFRDSCTVHGIDINYIESEGIHSHDYWAKSIPTHFKFFAEMVEK